MLILAVVLVLALAIVAVPYPPHIARSDSPRPGDLITYTRISGATRTGRVEWVRQGVMLVRFTPREAGLVVVEKRGTGPGTWRPVVRPVAHHD